VIVGDLALDPWSKFINTVKSGSDFTVEINAKDKKYGTVMSLERYLNCFVQDNRHDFQKLNTLLTQPFEKEFEDYSPSNEHQKAICAAYAQIQKEYEDKKDHVLEFLNIAVNSTDSEKDKNRKATYAFIQYVQYETGIKIMGESLETFLSMSTQAMYSAFNDAKKNLKCLLQNISETRAAEIKENVKNILRSYGTSKHTLLLLLYSP